MAFFVIAIHTYPESICCSEFLKSSFRHIYDIAVPFFYMTSGYLLFKKTQFPISENKERKKQINNYLKKILRLYFAWTIIYLPLTIYGFAHDHVPFLKGIIIFLRNVAFVGQNFYSWPLWYLLGLLVAIIIITILDYMQLSIKQIVLIAIVIFTIGQLSDYWQDTKVGQYYFKIFTTTRNGIFIGLVYTTLGAWISSMKTLIAKRYSIVIVLMSSLLSIFYHSELFTLVSSFFIFQWILQVNLTKISERTAKFLRIESTFIYFIHMLVLGVIHFVLPFESPNPMWTFIAVCVFSSAIGGIFIRHFSNTKLFKFLFN